VQNAINAGMEAIVPEEEITYFGWRGCGYILYDPETGTGACLITGGAAGAYALMVIGIIVLRIYNFTDRMALIVEGDTSFWIFEIEPPIFPEIGGYIIAGAMFLCGYSPIYKEISKAESFLREIANSKNKILYFMGHGGRDELWLWGGKEKVTETQIKGTPTSHLVYVHLDACYSAGLEDAFIRSQTRQAVLGYDSMYAGPIDFLWFDIPYLLRLCMGSSLESAKNYALIMHSRPWIRFLRKLILKKRFKTSDEFKVKIFGNEGLILKR
jgi:hypothetical protein